MSVAYPFVAIPHHIVRGGHGAINLAVLAIIVSHGNCFASIPTMAKEVGCGEKVVRKSLKFWKENAKKLGIEFEFKDGTEKHTTHTIRVSFPVMYDPEGVVAKQLPGGSRSATGVVAKQPYQGDQVRRINKKCVLLSQDEKELGFILT